MTLWRKWSKPGQRFACPCQHIHGSSGTAVSVSFVCWETRQTWTGFGQPGLSWRGGIGGNKFKLRDGKSWSDTREINRIEGVQALEGGSVASRSLEMPKTWLSSINLIDCAFKQSVGLNVPPSSVKVTSWSRLISRRVAFNLILCGEVPWGVRRVSAVPYSQPFGTPGMLWLPSSQMTSSWQEQCQHWCSLGSSWSARGLKHRACFSFWVTNKSNATIKST